MKVLKIFFVCFFFSCLYSYSQDTSSTSKLLYPNGRIKEEKFQTDSNAYVINTYFENGKLKSAVNFYKGKPVGEVRTYNKYGKTIKIINYQDGENTYTYKEFRDDGSVSLTGGFLNSKKFGLHERFDASGQRIEVRDFNKGKQVSLDYKYFFGKHVKSTDYKDRLKKKKITMSNQDGNKRTLKTGTFIDVSTYNNTYTHCLLDVYLQDSVVLSKFSYDLSPGDATLKYDSTFVMPIKEIIGVNVLRNNNHVKTMTATILVFGGAVLIIKSLILNPVNSGPTVFYEPATYGLAALGFVSFVAGVQFITKPQQKKYNKIIYGDK